MVELKDFKDELFKQLNINNMEEFKNKLQQAINEGNLEETEEVKEELNNVV